MHISTEYAIPKNAPRTSNTLSKPIKVSRRRVALKLKWAFPPHPPKTPLTSNLLIMNSIQFTQNSVNTGTYVKVINRNIY